jgi:hypothetical protein
MASYRLHSPAVLISVVILTLVFGSAVHAVEFAGGTGEPDDPYQVATGEQLIAIGSDPMLLDRHFVLVSDIDLDPNLPGGQVFGSALIARHPEPNSPWVEPAWAETFTGTFTGTFNGQGHVIRNLHITATLESSRVGLFGFVGREGRVGALRLESVEVTGGESVGALAGENWGVITQCHVTGLVRGYQYVGGLVGTNGSYTLFRWGLGTPPEEVPAPESVEGWISACSADVQVIGDTGLRPAYSRNGRLGGLVGQNSRGMIYACRAAGSVDGGEYVGGLVGYIEKGWIHSCYAMSRIHAFHLAGGVAGYNDGHILLCYAAGAVTADGPADAYGITGLMHDSPTYLCYWDIETTGCVSSSGGRGTSTERMRKRETFRGWGYENQWVLADGQDYPRLAWEGTPGAPLVDDPTPCKNGAGTEADPYQVSTAEEFMALGYSWPLFGSHFLLAADIDLSGIDANAPAAIGTRAIPFSGSFDGRGHRITGFRLHSPNQQELGMFGCIDPHGLVQDLTLTAADVCGEATVGILAGYNQGTIRNCAVDGYVYALSGVGGVCGTNGSTGVMASCMSGGDVAGIWAAGGLVGGNGGKITTCRSSGTVAARYEVAGGLAAVNSRTLSSCCSHVSVRTIHAAGGLVGYNTIGGTYGDPPGEILDSYADGAVAGWLEIGGLAGVNLGTIRRCYAAGSVSPAEDAGGLIGLQESEFYPTIVEQCYWDVETSGLQTSAAGTGLGTVQMKQRVNFNGWDFVKTWAICEGRDYPRLRWEGVSCAE